MEIPKLIFTGERVDITKIKKLLKIYLTLNRCTLTSSDKEEIMTGKMLTDKHMNFAQEILKKQLTFISGLECTLTFGKNGLLTKYMINIFSRLFSARMLNIGLSHLLLPTTR